MSLALYGNGMHGFVMWEMEVGRRVAMAQDSEDCGWSALDDLSYAQHVAEKEALIELRNDLAERVGEALWD